MQEVCDLAQKQQQPFLNVCLQNDELALFADKGDSGILAEESTAPTYNSYHIPVLVLVICRAAINIQY